MTWKFVKRSIFLKKEKKKSSHRHRFSNSSPRSPRLSHSCCSVAQSWPTLCDTVTPWTAARQASLSFTISQSLLKLTPTESVMPSNHLILRRPLSKERSESILQWTMQRSRGKNRLGKTSDLFKETGDIKRTFHAKMGSIKDRNGMDLTEAEDIKNTQKNCTKKIFTTQIITMVWSFT